MTCEDACLLIGPYLDGELELMRSLELEAHLKDCAPCARELAHVRLMQSSLRERAAYYRAPAALEGRVREVSPGAHRRSPERELHLPRVGWFLIGAAAAIALLMAFFKDLAPSNKAVDLIAREAVADHVRSLMASHLMDVASTDQHTVKPWFEGKLDFSPAVIDLKEQGFPLVGGRLDYLNNRAVAAIVYRRRAHVINLFVWPAPTGAADSSPHADQRDGYNLLNWSRAQLDYCAVSSLNADELRQFAQDLIARRPG